MLQVDGGWYLHAFVKAIEGFLERCFSFHVFMIDTELRCLPSLITRSYMGRYEDPNGEFFLNV